MSAHEGTPLGIADLANIFEFAPNDLNYNRIGKLSSEQRNKYMRLNFHWLILSGLLILVSILGWLFMLGVGGISYFFLNIFLFTLMLVPVIGSAVLSVILTKTFIHFAQFTIGVSIFSWVFMLGVAALINPSETESAFLRLVGFVFMLIILAGSGAAGVTIAMRFATMRVGALDGTPLVNTFEGNQIRWSHGFWLTSKTEALALLASSLPAPYRLFYLRGIGKRYIVSIEPMEADESLKQNTRLMTNPDSLR